MRLSIHVANKLARTSRFAAWRIILGALLFSAMPVGSAAPARAAENYRGHDPDSYECSSDFNILNRFSAPRSALLPRSTKYADVRFTLEDNVIAVKDASNSKDFVFITVDEKTKYCAFKEVERYDRGKEFSGKFDVPQCAIKYFIFRMKLIIDNDLPVRPFSLPRPPEYSRDAEKMGHFDRMDHVVEIDVYRAVDRRKKNLSAGCNEAGESPDSPYFGISLLGLMTNNKSTVNIEERGPLKLRQGETYSRYGRDVLTTSRPEPRPK
ncbi:hypothetical protein [Methylocystis iwaonis]|uniref:hypothetical protein n=1 Tax=Methylocystis iwaonis TaxID=2885079 RepID=UPI002490C65B|nr:hypothetical protein [Methylocystis iwaonis]